MMRKPVILCVDDTPNVLEGRQALLEASGYRVLTASGQEVLQVSVSNPVDLVLLDYHMPEMKGDVAARRMNAGKPDVPIVLLSGDDCPPRRVRAKRPTLSFPNQSPLSGSWKKSITC